MSEAVALDQTSNAYRLDPTIFESSPETRVTIMKRWMDKHPRIIVDENFSFNLGPESVLLNYKVSDEETLHSIEIRLTDMKAFMKTLRAIEKELRPHPAIRGTSKNSLASGYIREKLQRSQIETR
jgi:hypothetical protein